MLFADLLPASRVSAMLDAYIQQAEEKLAHLNAHDSASKSSGERFVTGFGRTIYAATLEFLRTHRAEIEQEQAAQAAE